MAPSCIQFSKRRPKCWVSRAARHDGIKSLRPHSGKLLQGVPAGRYSRYPEVAPSPSAMAEVASVVSPARERILEAAERVVGDVGAARMTLEGVAQAAGVSKGGLLYHFPTKEALL